MSKVAILTDSCAYLTASEAEELDIHVVPLKVRINGQVFEDGDPLTTERFFRKQEDGSNLPTISAPGVRDFEKAYTDLHKQTDKVLALHVSTKLSNTCYQSQLGAEALLGRCTIEVLDTSSTLLGQGILVKTAARAAQEGASIDEIVRLVRGLIPHIYIVFYVDTMDYLERSGTIGKAQALLGTMMNIKPMLFMEDGEIIPMEKVKTREKAIDKLTEFVAEFDILEQTVIFQRAAHATHETNQLQERMEQIFPEKEFSVIQYNPLLASFVGPNATGVIVYEGETGF